MFNHTVYLDVNSSCSFLLKTPEDGNSFAETYVGVANIFLYMSIVLCICYLILDLELPTLFSAHFCLFPLRLG
jgi:hypothetical protein